MNAAPPIRLLENASLGPAPLHPKFRLDEPLHPVQLAGFRRMSAAQKFRQMEQMYRLAVAMKRAQLTRQFSDWTTDALEREARRAVMYGPD